MKASFIHTESGSWVEMGVPSCIMARLLLHLVQEFNIGAVSFKHIEYALKETVDYHFSLDLFTNMYIV